MNLVINVLFYALSFNAHTFPGKGLIVSNTCPNHKIPKGQIAMIKYHR